MSILHEQDSKTEKPSPGSGVREGFQKEVTLKPRLKRDG